MTRHITEDKPTRVLISTLLGDLPRNHFDVGQTKSSTHMQLDKTHLQLDSSLYTVRVFVIC